MKITLNSQEKEVAAGTTLQQLIEQENLPMQNIAVAINNAIVPRKDHAATQLNEGDKIVIISAAYGG